MVLLFWFFDKSGWNPTCFTEISFQDQMYLDFEGFLLLFQNSDSFFFLAIICQISLKHFVIYDRDFQ